MRDDKKLGFIMMLDVSGSMKTALPMVKIDSKAFVRCARPGDQFGVNAFSDSAWWVYPEGSSPDILKVTEGLKETEEAIKRIEELKTYNMTHMGEAIELGNAMIAQADTALKAFVLLSDGAHNMGVDPVSVLGAEPPVYIAGLGWIYKDYFDKLLAKNSKSKYYNSPNAYQMMSVYNQILSDSSDANLSLNQLEEYHMGSDYHLESFQILEEDNDAQVSVVWSDKQYRYTPDAPSGQDINIVLIDPDGSNTDIQPDIVEEGYCIYNLHGVPAGEWKVLIQYSVAGNLSGTVAGIEYHTGVKTDLLLPSYCQRGEEISVSVEARRDGRLLEDVKATAHISQPCYSAEAVMNRFEKEMNRVELAEDMADNDGNRLYMLRQNKLKNEKVDILPLRHSVKQLTPDRDGCCALSVEDTQNEGSYNVKVEIAGVDPATNRPFKSLKARSVFVG